MGQWGVVIDVNLGRATASDVRAGLSPLAELMSSLHVLAEPDHHPESRTWATQVLDGMSHSLRSDLQRFSPLWARYRMRLFFPTSTTLDRSLADEIRALVNTPDDRFLPHVADAIHGRSGVFYSAAEVVSTKEWLVECDHKSFTRGDLAHALVADPDRFRTELGQVLGRAEEAFFGDNWSAMKPRLAVIASKVNAALLTREAADVVGSLAHMASRRDNSRTVTFDKLQSGNVTVSTPGLVLLPSVRTWPHVMVKMDPGLPVVIQFMEQEFQHALPSQSQAEVRRQLAVLSEPGRWELCRHLIGESITTSDLARRTNQTEPAVSRHLRHLREAGLVSSQREGRQVFHRMHPAVILRLGQETLTALMR